MLRRYLILIPLLFTIFIVTYQLNKPFVGHHDFMSSFEGMIAKNYLQYGPWQLKFGQVSNHLDGDLSKHKSYQTSYLPLLPLLISISYLFFGVSEWATRLAPAIFSIIGVYFLFLICQKNWNQKVAFFACFFYILNPMFIYFSKLPAPEPILVAYSLIIFYRYLIWIDKKSKKNLAFIYLSVLIAGFIGWPILYVCPLIILHSLLTNNFQKKLLYLLVLIILIPLLQFIHIYILTGEIGGGLIQTLQSRTTGSLSFGGIDFNLMNYLKQEISWLQVYFNRTTIFFSSIWFYILFKERLTPKNLIVLFFLIFGIAHPILFSRYVFIHDFLNFYLLPFFAISAALGLNLVLKLGTKLKVSEIVQYGFILTVFLLIAVERLPYSQALLKTDMNSPGLEMANLINSLQNNPNEVGVVSPRFDSFYGIFAGFYSNYGFKILSEPDLKTIQTLKSYKYIITIDEDINDRNYYEYLIKNNKYLKKGEWTIIYNE